MIVVLVPTSDPGLDDLPDPPGLRERRRRRPAARPVDDPEAALASSGSRARRPSSSATGDGARSCAASDGDARPPSSSTARPRRDHVYAAPRRGASRAVDADGEAEAAFLLRPTRIEDVLTSPRRGEVHAAEDDLLLPEAHLRSPLPSALTRDRLARALPRRASRTSRGVLARPADAHRARARAPRGRGGDDTTAIDAAAEDAVVRRLEALGGRLHARLGGARRAAFGAGGPTRGRRRPDRRLAERQARDPVLLALDRGRRRRHDGRRRLRLRLRLRHAARSGSASAAAARCLNGAPLDAPRPKDEIEILSFEATTTAASPTRPRRWSESPTGCGSWARSRSRSATSPPAASTPSAR